MPARTDIRFEQSRGRSVAGAWAAIVGWTWLVLVAVFLVVFLLPRKGVDFGDEGWVLSASLSAARGRHLNQAIPQAPFWVVNAALMAAGAGSYIAMRWAFYGLISASLAIALIAIDRGRPYALTA